VRPFQKASIERLVAEKISRFSDEQFEIDLSSGLQYPPIPVIVHKFRPLDRSLLVFKKFGTDKVGQESTFAKAYSPPLGILDFSQDLSSKLISHVLKIIDGERNYGEVSQGNTSQLTWDVYDAVRLYHRANPTVTSLCHSLIAQPLNDPIEIPPKHVDALRYAILHDEKCCHPTRLV
jgi:hypothetical protein